MPRKNPRRDPSPLQHLATVLLRDGAPFLAEVAKRLATIAHDTERIADALETPTPEATALAGAPYAELSAAGLSAEHIGRPVFIDDPDGGFEDLSGGAVPFVTGTAGVLVGFTRVPGRPASMEPTPRGAPEPKSSQPRVKIRVDVGAGTIVSLDVPMRALVRVNTRKA